MPLKIQNYGEWEGDRPRGPHPPACTCYKCNEERLAKEAAEAEDRRVAEYDRRVAQSQARQRAPVRNLSPRPPGPTRRGPASNPRPPTQPPRPPRPPSASSRESRGRPRRRQGSSRAALLWLLLIGAVAGVAIAALYFANPELFAPTGDKEPVALAVPPPTDEVPTETPTPGLTPTPVPTLTDAPEPTPALEPTATPTPPPRPTATPSPLIAYSGWHLDCPGCPVVVLDTAEPEVIGAAGLQPGDTVRVAGCTRAQTTREHMYVFEATDGNYSGVAVFDPDSHPGTLHDLECFEMLGEYRGVDQYAISVQYVDGWWEYEVVRGEAAREATAPDWEPAGTLTEFAVLEWAGFPETKYASVVRARTNPLYAARLATLLSNTPTPTPDAEPSPTPTPTPTLAPTSMPRPTSTQRPTNAPCPTTPPRPTSTPRPTPTQDETLAAARELMLELINEARADAGVPPVILGNNRAAQVHANNHLADCFGGHWGLDGTKSYMRYALAGGYQASAENTSGLEFCIRAEHGYAAIRSTEYAVRQAMDGFLNSPGHRRAVLDPAYRKVNLGIAWDRFNFRVMQQFEGDYVEYSRLPAIEGDRIAFEGKVKNGAVFGQGRWVHVHITYHPPLHPLTRGQVARAYCASADRPVAYLRERLEEGWSYPNDTLSATYPSCGDPRDVPPDAPPPQSYQEAHELARKVKATNPLVLVPALMDAVTASRWKVSGDSFSIAADIGDVLDERGPGIYAVILFGILSGDPEVISEYPIFHDVPRPAGYD